VLITYLTLHLTNHALALVSLGAAEIGRHWFLALWRNAAGTVLLYSALLTHALLALTSLYRRRSLRMPAWEATQLVFGLSIPAMLIYHVTGTRLAWWLLGVEDTYARVTFSLWAAAPLLGLRQVTLLAIAWTHGCLGLHFWLRLRPWYARWSTTLFALALLLPSLALLGFVNAGREAARLAATGPGRERVLWSGRAPVSAQQRRPLLLVQDSLLTLYGGALLGVLLARARRALQERRRGTIRLTYPGGRVVSVPPGFTVLEASRSAGIPHASVCGGRGRCSTCRVRVSGPPGAAPSPSDDERRVLRRLALPRDVRLACQLRPRGDLAVTPLLPSTATAADGHTRHDGTTGREQEIAVLFADLRRFTHIAERKLPYDVVFLLNRYFEAVGTAIERAGGVANQYTGDGVMALFGVESDADQGCRDAVAAAAAIVESLAVLNRELADELPVPLRIGIGIHAGPAVVGRMGHGETVYLTAVGDTVHVASRLEALTKDYDAELVISEEAARRAGLDVAEWPRHELRLRNRADPLTVCVIADARAARIAGSGSRT
jgi:adenylate cyclase